MLKGSARVILSLVVVTSLLAKAVPLQLGTEPLQGSEWRIETVDFTENVGWFTSIALDRSGRPHISHYDETNRDLKYSWWNGSAWINETIDTDGHVGYSISIKLDYNGIPHISYQQYHPDGDLKYAWKEGGVWHDEIVDSAGVVGHYTSIVLDGKGQPHISYYDQTKGDLKFAWKNGDDWKYMSVDSPGVVGQYTSMTLDANGNFHISYFDYENGDLKHAWKDGNTWKNETVDTSGNVGQDTSIAFDSSGYPHISYFDQTNQDLKHAWKDGNTWKNETVDSSGNVGYDTSIAFDGHGDPHISYYDQTNFNLKHAWMNDTVWKNEIVDSIGDVGRFASMVIDNESIPHISYFNCTSHDLKYATKVKLQENDPPVADAGPDQTVSVGDIVQFDGSGSYDLESPLFLSNETIVNDDTNNAKQISPSIAADDFGNVHVLWSDDRSGNLDVFYSVLNETVGKFSPNIRVNDDVGDRHQFARDLDIDHQGTVHALFGDGRNSRILIDVYYANLTIGSSGFDKNLMVNDDGPGQSYQAPTHIDADSAGNVHAVWWDGRLGVQAFVDVFYAKKIHDQESFSTNVRVNEHIPEYQASPFVLVDDDLIVHVVWNDHRDSTGWRIHYANSTDYGQTFNVNVKVNDIDGSFRMCYPELAFGKNGEMAVVWYDERDGGGNIYMSKLEPGQSSFSKNERVNDVLDTVNHSTIAIASDASGRYHIVWQDNRDGNADVYYMFITSDGQFSTSFRANRIKDAYQRSPSIAVDSDGNPHFVWLSNASGDYDTIYLGSSGQDLKYEWDFGDGHHGTGVKPTHAYDSPGVFNVVLTVTDSLGATDTDNCTITVPQSDQPPVADAGGPYFAMEGQTVLFDASASGTPESNETEYRWDFENDSIWDTVWSSSPFVNYTYPDDYEGNVALELRYGGTEGKEDVNVTGELKAFTFVSSEVSAAQSFVPSESTLAKILVDCSVNNPRIIPDDDLYLRIREDLNGSDLAVASVSEDILPRGPGGPEFWAEFDIPDIDVDVGMTYYIVMTSNTQISPYEVHSATDIYPDGAFYVWSQASGWDSLESYYDLRFRTYSGSEPFQGIAFSPVSVSNVPPKVETSVRIPEAEVSLRIAGEKWHDVTVEMYEDGVLITSGTLVRYPGSPDDQRLDLTQLQVDYSKKYSAIVRYTPEDDPINGQPNGANPCWIILRFSDGQELWIHHTFNVQHPDTYVWEVDLTAAILSHGMTFEAIAFDPGADELTFHWDFGDGTNATSFYSNGNGTYPVTIMEIINHVFPGSGTYTVVLTVEDDDGGIGMASLTIVIY